MTKPPEDKQRFIELRASGMTFTKIAQELGIDRNTAMNWQRDFQDEIAAAKAYKLEELIDKYRMTKEKRIELFGERLLAIQKELADRDLSDISTPKLFEMMIRCSKALEAESTVEFLSEDDIEARKNTRENYKQLAIFKIRGQQE
jgi:transcriptional regulator with XRE-family HTH domain